MSIAPPPDSRAAPAPAPDAPNARPAGPGYGVGPAMRCGYRILRKGAQLVHIAFFGGRVFNLDLVPRTGGVLLVCNHQSFLDPILATLALPRECNYMARDTLWDTPWLGGLMTYLNAFPVKRGAADLGAIKETLRRLRDGKLVLAFPEGTRTLDGEVGEMRAGVVLLARKTRVPVVPTVILGAFEAWPRTRKLPRPSPVLVAYGAPVYPHQHPEWDDDACVAEIRGRIIALQRRYERHPLLRRP